MSEPYWVPLGASPIDYEGTYNAGTQYVPGDVVVYGGTTYVCVNPALGQTPPAMTVAALPVIPLVTALPASPYDGQEVILTDSLTAGTYQWRLRYVAARATNKWVFVGGPSCLAEVVTSEAITTNVYTGGPTTGPSIVVPIAGEYLVAIGCRVATTDANLITAYMSYDIGATGAVDADAIIWFKDNTANAGYGGLSRERQKSLGAVTLTARYKKSAGAMNLADRWMRLTPIAVGG